MSDSSREVTDEQLLMALRQTGRLPRHVAVIMDGNGRWAGRRKMPRVDGHRTGVSSVRQAVETCGDLGVEYLTLYAFSTENWKRPKSEINVLMDLLKHYLRAEVDELDRNNVRLRAIGQINALPKKVGTELHRAIERLDSNTGLTLTLALSYSGRWDIVRAVQTLALDVRRGTLSPEDIDEGTFRGYLTTADMPDPDLLIRTSGEMRLSNFLLWEMAYGEIVVTDVLWPDFDRNRLLAAIAEYVGRERRFGLTGEQIDRSDTGEPATSKIRDLIESITRTRR